MPERIWGKERKGSTHAFVSIAHGMKK